MSSHHHNKHKKPVVQDSDDDLLFGPSQTFNPIAPIINSSSSTVAPTANRTTNNNNNAGVKLSNEDVTFLFDSSTPNSQQQQQQQQLQQTQEIEIKNTSTTNPPEKKTTSSTMRGAWVPRAADGTSYGYKVVFTPPTMYEVEDLQRQIDWNRINPRGAPRTDVHDVMAYSKPERVGDESKQQPLRFSDLAPMARTYFVATTHECHFCKQGETDPVNDPLFKPCPCDRVWHRHSCFRKWRASWITPRNYFSCPDCLFNYSMERIKSDKESVSKEQIKRKVYCEIGKMWASILFFVAASIAILASIAYGADRSDKNVPIIIKALFTSVAYGFPDSNTTTAWRAEFKDPNVSVSQYYGMLGALITSCFILCFASCTSIDFSSSGSKEHDREKDDLYLATRRRSNDGNNNYQQNVDDAASTYYIFTQPQQQPNQVIVMNSTTTNNNNDENNKRRSSTTTSSSYSRYSSTTYHGRSHDNCCLYCRCSCLDCYYCGVLLDQACCSRGGGSSSIADQCCNCSKCCSEMRCDCCPSDFGGGCSGSDCKGPEGGIIAIVVLIAIAIILISAVFVLILYGTKKAADVHKAMAKMIEEQQYELEGQTVVLGMGESLRPIDAV